MNRTAKATIYLLLLCIGALAFLLFRQNYEQRKLMNTIRQDCTIGITSSNEINALADVLSKTKTDTSRQYLQDQYDWIRNDAGRWNNSTAFLTACIIANADHEHDSLLRISDMYRDESTSINGFLLARHNADELQPGELATLINQMHRLAGITALLENYNYNE